jgi:hypothetical protein
MYTYFGAFVKQSCMYSRCSVIKIYMTYADLMKPYCSEPHQLQSRFSAPKIGIVPTSFHFAETTGWVTSTLSANPSNIQSNSDSHGICASVRYAIITHPSCCIFLALALLILHCIRFPGMSTSSWDVRTYITPGAGCILPSRMDGKLLTIVFALVP